MSVQLNSDYFNPGISIFLKPNLNFRFEGNANSEDFNVTHKSDKISKAINGKLKEDKTIGEKISCSLFFCTNLTNNPPFIFDYPNILRNLVTPQVRQAFLGRFINWTLEHIVQASGDTMTQVMIELDTESKPIYGKQIFWDEDDYLIKEVY